MVALIAAIVCAVAGMVVLVAAIIVGKTLLAVIAVVIAIVGLILLSRDWIKESRSSETEADADQRSHRREPNGDTAPPGDGLKPELFTPDVSYEEAVQGVDDDEDLDLEGKS
ncbi:MAG: hypothetical protein WA317_18100 [Mycobacterium sp.]|uniref:hypothetical protein n=1 Tax=Mycobacterium sp. TaxID=1785 RepID=UPI003CC62EB2